MLDAFMSVASNGIAFEIQNPHKQTISRFSKPLVLYVRPFPLKPPNLLHSDVLSNSPTMSQAPNTDREDRYDSDSSHEPLYAERNIP